MSQNGSAHSSEPAAGCRYKVVQILFDIKKTLQWKIDLTEDTIATAVNILDRYGLKRDLETNRPDDQKLSQLALVCFKLASNIQEPIEIHLSSLINIFENKYPVDRKEAVLLERDILFALDFDFNYPMASEFIGTYLTIIKHGIGEEDYQIITQLCQMFVQVTLVDPKFIRYKPSVLAKCIIMLALHFLENNRVLLTSLKDNYFQSLLMHFLSSIIENIESKKSTVDDSLQSVECEKQ